MVKVGVIGMGFGAAVHVPACRYVQGLELVALADHGSGRALKCASELSHPVTVFQSGREAVLWEGVDAVCIATPATTQSGLVRAALLAGKHVLCEKPFGKNSDEVSELLSIGKKQNLLISACYEFRYDPLIQKLALLVQSGQLGRIQNVSVRWHAASGLNPSRRWRWRNDANQCGGVLVDWCSHALDYCCFILQDKVKSVQCRTEIRVPMLRNENDVELEVTAPDLCEMECKFVSGAWASFSVSNTQQSGLGHRIEFFGDDGWACFHLKPPFRSSDKSLSWFSKHGSGEQRVQTEIDYGKDDRILAMSNLMADFAGAISTGAKSKFLPTCEDAHHIWRVIEAAERSHALGHVQERVVF